MSRVSDALFVTSDWKRVSSPPVVVCAQKAAETKKTEILVLDPKRSNAINIGMTVLPAVHVIKTAILNFDEFAIGKEGIEVGARPSSFLRPGEPEGRSTTPAT